MNVSSSNQSIINFFIRNGKNTFKLQEFINQFLSLWHEGTGTCLDCLISTKIFEKLEILKTNDVVVFKVNSLSINQNGQLQNNYCSIKEIPISKVEICRSTYQVNYSIFTDSGRSNQHFISYIRNKNC